MHQCAPAAHSSSLLILFLIFISHGFIFLSFWLKYYSTDDDAWIPKESQMNYSLDSLHWIGRPPSLSLESAILLDAELCFGHIPQMREQIWWLRFCSIPFIHLCIILSVWTCHALFSLVVTGCRSGGNTLVIFVGDRFFSTCQILIKETKNFCDLDISHGVASYPMMYNDAWAAIKV